MANGYGTVSNPQNGHTVDPISNNINETGPLLGSNTPASKHTPNGLHQIKTHFTTDVTKHRGDLALLACYIITGILDSCSVSTWGSFVSMQTGNTIYLGVGIIAPSESSRWIRSGISILFFCLGSAFFAAYHRSLGQRRRFTMVSSYFLQLLAVVAAALMVTLGPKTGTSGPVTRWILVPIALIAFQSAGQAVISRAVQFGSLTSVVLTSIYLDLFSDQKLFAGPTRNVERNRRVAAPLLLLVGAMCGGLIARSELGIAGALWTAAILKSLVIVNWIVWPAEKEQ